MDRKALDLYLDIIDQTINTAEPWRAEYFLGYQRGMEFHRSGEAEEPARDHFLIHNFNVASVDRFMEAFARGYRDGRKGGKVSP